MVDGPAGRALVALKGEPSERVGVHAELLVPKGSLAVAKRPQDRRRRGRLPDALLRGLLVDRLA